jgi:hypothetical protein
MEDLPPLPTDLAKHESDASAQTITANVDSMALKDFLEKVPPGREAFVSSALVTIQNRSPYGYTVAGPVLELHCDNEKCGGTRTFNKSRSADSINKDALYINRSPGGHEAISTDMTTILKPSLLSPSLLEKFGSPAGIRSTPLRLTDSVFHYPEYLRSC